MARTHSLVRSKHLQEFIRAFMSEHGREPSRGDVPRELFAGLSPGGKSSVFNRALAHVSPLRAAVPEWASKEVPATNSAVGIAEITALINAAIERHTMEISRLRAMLRP